MHQRLFFLEFLYFTGSQKVRTSEILTTRMTYSCIPTQACAWVASVAYYSRGRRLLPRRIDVTGRSPTTHPRKRLDHGMVDGPQTIAAEMRCEREGYTPAAFSLQSSWFHPNAFAFQPTAPSTPPARTMAEPTRSSVDVEAPEAFHASNPPPTDGPLIGVVSHLPVPPFGGGSSAYYCPCCLSSFN